MSNGMVRAGLAGLNANHGRRSVVVNDGTHGRHAVDGQWHRFVGFLQRVGCGGHADGEADDAGGHRDAAVGVARDAIAEQRCAYVFAACAATTQLKRVDHLSGRRGTQRELQPRPH